MKSNSLLPLYNQILTYKYADNGDDRDEDEIVDDIVSSYGMNKHKYLRFVLFPDLYEPVRPPSLFPYPTHMFRDVGVVNLTATGGALYLAWSPFVRSVSTLYSSLVTYNGGNTISATADIGTTVTGEVHTRYDPPAVTGIDAEHVRGIGAYIQLSYIGRLDEIAGTIEVGVAIDDMLQATDASGTRYVPTSKLKGLYQYKRLDVSQGVRCVWLPLTATAFEQSGVIGQITSLNQVYHIHILGAPATANAFRVDFGYYYDGVVDETGYNTLMPKKAQRDPVTRDAIIQAVNENNEKVSVTPANPAENGLASQIWNSVKQGFARNVGNLVDFGTNEGFSLLKNGAMFLK